MNPGQWGMEMQVTWTTKHTERSNLFLSRGPSKGAPVSLKVWKKIPRAFEFSLSLSIYTYICIYIYIYLSIYLSVSLSLCLSLGLFFSFCLSPSLSLCLSLLLCLICFLSQICIRASPSHRAALPSQVGAWIPERKLIPLAWGNRKRDICGTKSTGEYPC